MVGPGRTVVTGPAPAPLPFGLLSAAVVVDDDNPKITAGVTFETLTCGVAHLTAEECFSGDTAPDPVDDEGVWYTDGDMFGVYALHKCAMPAGGYANAERVARLKLAAGEGRAIEEGFAAAYLTLAPVDADEYPDLTAVAGTAMAPLDAVAVAEEWAAALYSGRPTLHVARSTGAILTNRTGVGASAANGRLETGQGSIVASGAGYLDASQAAIGGVTPGAGERWLFVTGAVMLRRGPVSVTGPVRVQADDGPTNTIGLLAHRPVVAAAECIRGRILVQSPTAAAVL